MSNIDPGATATSDPLGRPGRFATNGGDEPGAKEQAQEQAQQAAGQAKEQAQQAAGQAKDRARTLVDERSTQAGQQVRQQAGDLRTVGEQLREQGKEGPAKIADQAAQRAERLGGYLEESDADRILGDIEDFGRRQPWAVALGGLALGFAASRFLKASSAQRYQVRSSGRSASQRTTPALPRTAGVGGTGVDTGVGTGGLGTGAGVGTGAGTYAPPVDPVVEPPRTGIPDTPPTGPDAPLSPPVPPAPGTTRYH